MDRWEKGMLAKSLAGHDKGKIYVIINIEETQVYLADGDIRTLNKLKKKKKKHVQLIRQKNNIEDADDASIRNILNKYRKTAIIELMEET